MPTSTANQLAQSVRNSAIGRLTSAIRPARCAAARLARTSSDVIRDVTTSASAVSAAPTSGVSASATYSFTAALLSKYCTVPLFPLLQEHLGNGRPFPDEWDRHRQPRHALTAPGHLSGCEQLG